MVKLMLAVFLGSGLGGVCRWGVSQMMGRCNVGGDWPWATFAVNIIGCLIIGAVYGWCATGCKLDPQIKLMLTTGFCGGLTTFSTFSYETLTLITSGHTLTGIAYAAASFLAGLLCAWAGYALAIEL